jgi:hypothetical protein
VVTLESSASNVAAADQPFSHFFGGCGHERRVMRLRDATMDAPEETY